MRATFCYADPPGMYNSSFYRVFCPAKYLEKAGHEIKLCHVDGFTKEMMSDVVVWEREISESMVTQLTGLGVRRIIVTFDDAYHVIPTDSGSYHYWKGHGSGGDHLRSFQRALKMPGVEAIVPSRNLARDYDARYVPNYHDPDLWKSVSRTRRSANIVIGWGGSQGHIWTWRNSTFSQALREVCNKYPKVSVWMYGYSADDALRGHSTRFESRGWLPFEKWPHAVAQFDIMIAPLSGRYDDYRSNLKLIEAGLAGVPFVATQSGEYPGAVGGLLVNNTSKQWVRALSYLIDNPDKRKLLGEKGKQWAQRYLMTERVSEYEKILWPETYA